MITGAAIIMIAVFASFVLGGQRLLQEIGTGFAVAVTLDAFLIRLVLVPAVMYILGDRNWQLPARLRWLPHLHIEPSEAPAPGPPGPSIDADPGIALHISPADHDQHQEAGRPMTEP